MKTHTTKNVEEEMQFAEILFLERGRLPLFCPVILSLGILFGVHFPFTSWEFLWIFVGSSIVLASILHKNRISAFSILLFSLGIYVAQTGGILDTNLLANKKFIDREYDKISFKADVGFIEETHPTMKGMQRVIFKNMNIPGLAFIKTAKMTCGSKLLKGIEPKDSVKVFGRLLPYKAAAIPNSFDPLQYNSLIKMDATGIVFGIKKIKSKSSDDFMENFSYFRFYLTKAISENISKPESGVAAALLTGDKSAIDPKIRDVFIKSGTAHILAISGLHMSILAGIAFFIFFRLFLYAGCFFQVINPKKCAAVITIPCTLMYLALSGFSPSAIRAFIMTTVCLSSITMGRGALSIRSVSLAAFLILLFDSASLFLVSFQLSFSAVLALISVYEIYCSRFTSWNLRASFWQKAPAYLATSAITTLVATLATLPISIATFNRLSCSSIFGNLIAIPLTSIIIAPLGIASLIFGYFTNFFTKIFQFSITVLVACISFVSSLPGSDISLKSPTQLTLSVMIIGGIILCLLKTKLKHIGSLAMFASLVLYYFDKTPNVVFPPEEPVVCFVEDGKFYTTSIQKGKNKIKSIQRNLGFQEDLVKKEFKGFEDVERKIYKQGLFLWTKDGKILDRKQISQKRHPYCPAYYENLKE